MLSERPRRVRKRFRINRFNMIDAEKSAISLLSHPRKQRKKLTLCRPDRLRSAPIRENKEKTADDTHLLLL